VDFLREENAHLLAAEERHHPGDDGGFFCVTPGSAW
jgi:hypothetical protein